MSKQQPDRSTRRSLLQTLAAGTAATFIGVEGARASAASSPLSAGVLLPESSLYPQLAERYLGGLRLALKSSSAPVPLAVQPVGPRRGDLVAAAQRLLTGGARLLVMLGDGPHAEVQALAEQHHTPLIVSELGGLMPRGERVSPFVFRNSLQLWQSQWALGTWSARHLGKRVQVVTTLRESGYDLPYAFGAGFASAGGTVLGTSFIDTFGETSDLSAALEATGQLRPDHVHLVSSDPQALSFLGTHARSAAVAAPLSVSGLALAEPFRAGLPAVGRRSVLSWASDLPGEAARSFAVGYQRSTGHQADAVAALGHETGCWIVQSLAAVQGQTHHTRLWLLALASAHFQGPRGEVRVDRLTQQAQAPLYLRQATVTGGHARHQMVETLAPPPAQHPAIQVLSHAPRSGISTTYLHG